MAENRISFPGFLSAIAPWALLFGVTIVNVPAKFMRIFEEFRLDLPLPTKLCIALGRAPRTSMVRDLAVAVHVHLFAKIVYIASRLGDGEKIV